MEITKMLTLSTVHIRPETADLLNDKESPVNQILAVYPEAEYGWFICIPSEYEDFEDNQSFEIPDDLLCIMNYCHDNKIEWLCLDRDGEECDDVNQYGNPLFGKYHWGDPNGKRCPKCGGQEFAVTAHVTQDWVVDENGEFMKCLNDCVEVTHNPDDDDLWECEHCGFSAAGSEFNPAESADDAEQDEAKEQIFIRMPELAYYDENHEWDLPFDEEGVSHDNMGQYRVIFDVGAERYYCDVEAINMQEALGIFFKEHPHITYSMVVDHTEV